VQRLVLPPVVDLPCIIGPAGVAPFRNTDGVLVTKLEPLSSGKEIPAGFRAGKDFDKRFMKIERILRPSRTGALIVGARVSCIMPPTFSQENGWTCNARRLRM